MYNTLLPKIVLTTVITLLVGCSSSPEPKAPPATTPQLDYSFKTATSKFINADHTRQRGVVVDKGMFYPKETFAFRYRYCSASEDNALQDMVNFNQLVDQVCHNNAGSIINLNSGSWCVQQANTPEETPIFAARISATELWSDICMTGPFITLRVIENRDISQSAWVDGAKLLGYQPYSNHRILVSKTELAHLNDMTPSPDQEMWTEETSFIASHVGETVCIYKKAKNDSFGVTYKGKVDSIKDNRIRVLATRKIKGDIRIAPISTPLPWHKKAYIEADVKSWFLCE